MKVEITCPETNVGDVLGDLNARRGQIEDVGFRGQQRVITAKVPLRRMFGYATDLRSATQGRANYSMQFDSYDAWESDRRSGRVTGVVFPRASCALGRSRERATARAGAPTNTAKARRRVNQLLPAGLAQNCEMARTVLSSDAEERLLIRTSSRGACRPSCRSRCERVPG